VFAAAEKEDTRLEMDNEILDEAAELPGTRMWRTEAAEHIFNFTIVKW
jgi:hypothetical protein